MLDTRSVLEPWCSIPARTRCSGARARSIPELYEKTHARARSIPELFDARPPLVVKSRPAMPFELHPIF